MFTNNSFFKENSYHYCKLRQDTIYDMLEKLNYSNEENYQEYKLFEKFQFALAETLTQNIIPNCQYSGKKDVSDIHSLDFETNGRLVDNDPHEPIDFTPLSNPTPTKCVDKIQSNFAAENPFAFKKHIVYDSKHSSLYKVIVPPQDANFSFFITPNINIFIYYCAFCKNNNASSDVYLSHVLRDTDGRICCPILRSYSCPNCGANGDNAHTIKYCPLLISDQRLKKDYKK